MKGGQSMAKLRIMLVDDHALMRSGLQLLIDAQPDMEVIGEAESGRVAVALAQRCRPDTVVMDVSMPELGGADATVQLLQIFPAIRVLILTRHGEQWHLRRVLEAGAAGYAIKQTAPDELIHAIRTVAAGGTYIEPSLTRELIERYVGHTAPGEHEGPRGRLTERETEVLRLVAWGLSNKEIAAQLHISVKTVEFHKANGIQRLGLSSRTDIVRYALAQGWLQADQDP
jgi:two-component system, NarL family, response regulator NreC